LFYLIRGDQSLIGEDSLIKSVEAGPVVIAQFEEPIFDIQDNRENADELYQFKVELRGQTIEMGDKKSGLPSYKITDEEGNWVEWKVQIPGVEFMGIEVGENFVSYDAGNLGVKYEISQSGIKPYYTLKEKPETNNFILNFDLDFSPELELVANPKGQINAYTLFDKYGVPIFEIKSPDAVDALGQKTYPNLLILQTPSTSSGQAEAKKAFIFLDPEFLKSAIYPITIDPTTVDSAAAADSTEFANKRELFTDSNDNLLAVYLNSTDDVKVAYCNASADCTNSANWTIDADTPIDAFHLAAAIDSSNDLHIAVEDTESRSDMEYIFADVIYTGNDISDITFSSTVLLLGGATNKEERKPSIIILHDGKPAVVWSHETGGGVKDSKVYFMRCINTCTGAASSNWGDAAGNVDGVPDEIHDTAANLKFTASIAQMPGAGTDADNFWVFWTESGGAALKFVKATCSDCAKFTTNHRCCFSNQKILGAVIIKVRTAV